MCAEGEERRFQTVLSVVISREESCPAPVRYKRGRPAGLPLTAHSQSYLLQYDLIAFFQS